MERFGTFRKLTAPQLRYPPSMQKVPPSKASRGQKNAFIILDTWIIGSTKIFGRFSFSNMNHT